MIKNNEALIFCISSSDQKYINFIKGSEMAPYWEYNALCKGIQISIISMQTYKSLNDRSS